LQQFQDWYLQAIVTPTATKWGLKEEYSYISPSLARFPNGCQQVRLARAAGFGDAVHYPLAGGMMGVLAIAKPDLNSPSEE
jgi:demethylmenaquinone methyltransferase/2-methoxy-6-polyprenyl-1,4-benzoquinol methylase